MKNLVIFGAGKIAECMAYFFTREGRHRVCAYTCDKGFMEGDAFSGKPLVDFSRVESMYPPQDYEMFVALGYQNMNTLRKEKYEAAKAKGYRLTSYISPAVRGDFNVGENSAIMDGVCVQPRACFGANILVWGGAVIGHHAMIRDHCWVTGGANIGGASVLGEESFVGLNATVGNEVKVGRRSLIGANALITRDVAEFSVLVTRDTGSHRLRTDQFLRLTDCF